MDRETLLREVTKAAGPGAAAIVAERIRQREVEGWTSEHDDEHAEGEMAIAAACYAVNGLSQDRNGTPLRLFQRQKHAVGCDFCDIWPWDLAWDKRSKHPRDRSVAIAGALLAAELDRIGRGGK